MPRSGHDESVRTMAYQRNKWSCDNEREKQEISKKIYSPPLLTKFATEELSLVKKLAPFSITYMYINDAFAERRDFLISEAFAQSRVQKYRIMFDILPRTFDRRDIVIVGGNDPARLGSFIKWNLPLLKYVPTIGFGHNLLPKRRAELLNLGFDDIVNLRGVDVEELRAKVLAIVGRYQIANSRLRAEQELATTASQVCELDGLFLSQKKILMALMDAPDNFCAHETLSIAASREHTDLTPTHLRVLIHKMRPHLRPGYRIVNVYSEGYRLERCSY